MKGMKQKEARPVTGFRLHPDLVARVRKEARDTRRTPRVIVEMALEQFFKKSAA